MSRSNPPSVGGSLPARLAARVRRLWSGGVPLVRAFWDYAVIGGFVVNLAATIGSMALVVRDAPPWLAVVVHFLALPYNVLVLVAVWRSAGNYAGSPLWAKLARAAVVVWVLVATVL